MCSIILLVPIIARFVFKYSKESLHSDYFVLKCVGFNLLIYFSQYLIYFLVKQI